VRLNAIIAVALVSVVCLGCLSGPARKEVVLPSIAPDGKLLRCLHYEDGIKRDTCLMFLAVSQKNGEYCGGIRDNRQNLICDSMLSGTVTKCLAAFNKTTDDGSAYCIAVYNKKELECQNIGDANLSGECVSLVSLMNEDKFSCGILKEEKLRSKCITEFALNYGDHLLCELVTDNESADDCFMEYAISGVDKTLCDKVQESSKRFICLERVKVRGTDPADCLLLKDKDEWQWCISAVAYDRIDADICKLLTDQKNDFACVERIKGVA
jgi:hypothetical protein